MTAKEMFKELDYHQIEDSEDYKIVYKRGVRPRPHQNNSALPKKITFWKTLKSFDFEYGRQGSYLYLELLQAINKQAEELGWNE
jgi:hypothetical protein